MSGSSHAFAVKASVVALIKALPAAVTEKWDIDHGFSKSPERTWVYCGQITWESSEWVTNRSREEDFKVQLVINLKRRRSTPAAVEAECARIAGLIEAMVKANPNLGNASVITSGFEPKRLDAFPADDFVEGQYEAEIRAVARF